MLCILIQKSNFQLQILFPTQTTCENMMHNDENMIEKEMDDSITSQSDDKDFDDWLSKNGSQFRCPMCDWSNGQESQFWSHIENFHRIAKQFVMDQKQWQYHRKGVYHQCKLCSEEFILEKANLESHLSEKHRGIQSSAYFREFVQSKVKKISEENQDRICANSRISVRKDLSTKENEDRIGANSQSSDKNDSISISSEKDQSNAVEISNDVDYKYLLYLQ